MILLREKGAHGASARCEQICMLLPQRSQGSTLKNHMLMTALLMKSVALRGFMSIPTYTCRDAETTETPLQRSTIRKSSFDTAVPIACVQHAIHRMSFNLQPTFAAVGRQVLL